MSRLTKRGWMSQVHSGRTYPRWEPGAPSPVTTLQSQPSHRRAPHGLALGTPVAQSWSWDLYKSGV